MCEHIFEKKGYDEDNLRALWICVECGKRAEGRDYSLLCFLAISNRLFVGEKSSGALSNEELFGGTDGGYRTTGRHIRQEFGNIVPTEGGGS